MPLVWYRLLAKFNDRLWLWIQPVDATDWLNRSAGIDELHAGLISEDKVRAVQQDCLRTGTLMVGDGINDASALAAASVGVDMGGGGATASAQAAGIVLLVDRLVELG